MNPLASRKPEANAFRSYIHDRAAFDALSLFLRRAEWSDELGGWVRHGAPVAGHEDLIDFAEEAEFWSLALSRHTVMAGDDDVAVPLSFSVPFEAGLYRQFRINVMLGLCQAAAADQEAMRTDRPRRLGYKPRFPCDPGALLHF